MAQHFTCPECHQIGQAYCLKCNTTHWQNNFSQWSSGNPGIDQFIRKTQNEGTTHYQVLEWIPFSEFEDVDHFADGGFGNVYKAVWRSGPISNYYENFQDDTWNHHYDSFWNFQKSQWNRLPNNTVAIKKIKNGNGDFLKEVENSWQMNCDVIGSELINRIYGITHDPNTDQYAIVTKFYENGNLRQTLSQNDDSISWCKLLEVFSQISAALYIIHSQDYTHRDFHSGNILIRTKSSGFFEAVISDFGLSLHADSESSGSRQVYGVLPFIAPEVLCSGEYSTASDIYGFGMIMYEVLSGKPPFVEREYDANLVVAVCNSGQRPVIPEDAPSPYVDLMKQCWDSDPTRRPDAKCLTRHFNAWFQSLMSNEENDTCQAFLKSEKPWKARLHDNMTPKATHSSYTSKNLVDICDLSFNFDNGM